GGETVRVETSLPNPVIVDNSPDLSELLVWSCPEAVTGRPQECPLWVLPVVGHSPRRLGTVLAAMGAAWSPDGKQIAYVHDDSLYLARSDDADSHKIVSSTIPRRRIPLPQLS